MPDRLEHRAFSGIGEFPKSANCDSPCSEVDHGAKLFIGFAQSAGGAGRCGQSRRGAAEDLKVSPSFSVKLVARHRRTGSFAPEQQGRPPGTGKLSPYRDFLIGRVKEKPDITMPELAAELERATVSRPTRHRCRGFCARPGSAIKKTLLAEERARCRRRQGSQHLDRSAPADHAGDATSPCLHRRDLDQHQADQAAGAGPEGRAAARCGPVRPLAQPDRSLPPCAAMG